MGVPSDDLLPDFERFFSQAPEPRHAREAMRYGTKAGQACFRETLGQFLSQCYAPGLGPEHLFISNGVSQAIAHCIAALADERAVFVQDPTYFLAKNIIRDDCRRAMIACRESADGSGICVDSLEAKCRELRASPHGLMPRLLYCIPTFNNPSGETLPLDKRRALVRLAAEHGLLLLCDETYHLLPFVGAPPVPPSMLAVADELGLGEHVVSLGSFTKILAPGLRLGWVATRNASVLERLGATGVVSSGGGLAPLTSLLVDTLLRRKAALFETHLRKLRSAYSARSSALEVALRRELAVRDLADAVRFRSVTGGFFFWLQLQSGELVARVQREAAVRKVHFHAGSKFAVDGRAHEHCMRLSFAFMDEARLERGAAVLADAMLAAHLSR